MTKDVYPTGFGFTPHAYLDATWYFQSDGMANFVPAGTAAEFFGLLGGYAPPPPPGTPLPLLWGDEEHVRELFSDRVFSLELMRRSYRERAASPRDYVRLFEDTFGPVIAIRAGLAEQPERAAAFDRDLRAFATHENLGAPGGPAEYAYDYLLVVARKAGEA